MKKSEPFWFRTESDEPYEFGIGKREPKWVHKYWGHNVVGIHDHPREATRSIFTVHSVIRKMPLQGVRYY